MAVKWQGLLSTAVLCGLGGIAFSQASLASSLTTLTSFPGRGPDQPIASLSQYGNALFGTFAGGGPYGYGGVFKVKLKNGSEKTLHEFTGTPDGNYARVSLTAAGSLLYGITFDGGEPAGGTIYTVDPLTGSYKTAYSFPLKDEQATEPDSALTPYGSTLIGTTSFGGGSGSLYQFDPATGAVTTLYDFKFNGKKANGHYPSGTPLVMGQKVFGVTTAGGEFGYGSIYEFDFTTGREKPLYAFQGGQANSNLIEIGDELYGVMSGSTGGPPDYGTVYRFDLTAKTFSLVHAFGGQAGSDGANPNSELLYVNGVIYGTTSAGGTSNAGTIYTVDPTTGVETTLYSFTNGTDGGSPYGGLLQSHGSFYGTTTTGGANATGTVFNFTP